MSLYPEHDDTGCAFITGGGGRRCGASRRPGSSYCPPHHALCYLPRGGQAERAEERHRAALAKLGARWVRPSSAPPG